MAKDYVRKKPIVSGTISPIHKKKIDQLVENGEFASVSDFLGQAVNDFLKKFEPLSNENPQSKLTNADLNLIKKVIREQIEEMFFDQNTK
ncbi:MAG: hypothetical protein FWE54_01900 [Methanimicrococcus sp.]|nr:hypothetical protein [Methanimicrococcus sp.]